MAVSLKKIAETMMDAVTGSWDMDQVIPHGASQAGPVEKDGTNYRFDVTYFRQRGNPKQYRVTIEEIY